MATATKHPKQVAVTITEGLTSSARVDRDAGMIRGVKLIGFDSKNGRHYPPAVLKSATGVYESAKVNIDHPERDPTQPRKYSERFGVIRNARFVEGQGVFGDFQFNPKHPLSEQVCWDAENNPEALGFSHNALLRVGKPLKDGREQIEQIIQVRSMDLVADPATTKSLYESEEPMDTDTPATTGGSSDPLEMIVDSIALKIGEIAKAEGDPKSKVKQIADLLKKQDKIMALLSGGTSSAGGTDAGGATPAEESLKTQVALLTEQLGVYRELRTLAAELIK